MKKIHALFLTSSILLLSGCSSSGHLEKASPSFKAYLGASHGGIIENTDLSLLESSPPDAYSGATKVGFNAGIHYEYPLQHISLETGIDGFLNSQTLSYQDDFAGFHGTRDLMVSQLRIPVILNLSFLKKKQENGIIQLRLGLSPGFCFYGVDDHSETLPSYDKHVFTIGPLLGTDIIPLRFENGSELGISLELFRSIQEVYTDYYQLGETPGLSYLKFGLVYRFKN
jgi:hypothetical protein